MSEPNDLDKPIWGAAAIGAEANLTPRQAVYALERGYLPRSAKSGCLRNVASGNAWKSMPPKQKMTPASRPRPLIQSERLGRAGSNKHDRSIA
jgi:hypothetical protein